MGCEHKKTQTLVGDNDTERVVCCDCGETLAEARVESGESLRITQLESKVRQLEENLKLCFKNDAGLRDWINTKIVPNWKHDIDLCLKRDEEMREWINTKLIPNVKLRGCFF